MFPSMDAFGGWGAVLGHRVGALAEPIRLSALNKDYHRFPDTYFADYASLMRDPITGKDLGPLSSGSARSIRVAFVGAGIGNLIAAYELARCGMIPIVFEASPWVGGRLHSQYVGQNPGELGAMRFPGKSKLFWHYYAKYWEATHPGDDPLLEPFPNPGVVPTHINWQDAVYQFSTQPPYDKGSNLPKILLDFKAQLEDRWGPTFSVPNPGGFDITLKQVQDVLAKAVLSPDDNQLVKTFWQYCINKYEARSLASVLADSWNDKKGNLVQWGTNELNAFATLGLGTGGFGPLFSVSFLELLRLFVWDYSTEYQLPGTLTDFAQWMAAQVEREIWKLHPTMPGPFIHTKAQVQGVTVRVDGKQSPWVVVDVNGQPWPFAYAVVGMSTRAMQYLKLDANFAPSATATAGTYLPYALAQHAPPPGTTDFKPMIESVQAAIKRTNMMSASKTFTSIPSKSFEPGSWPQYYAPDAPIKPILVTLTDKYPRQAYWLKSKNENSTVLVSYAWGNDSTKMEAIRYGDERNAMLATAFAQMTSNADAAAEYSNVRDILAASMFTVTVDWQRREGIFGAFKLDYPGDYYHTASLAFHYTIANATDKPVVPAQLVYLAGCSISFLGGWIEGAAMSAINAATAILKFESNASVRSKDLLSQTGFHQYRRIGPVSADEKAASPDEPQVEDDEVEA